MKAYLRRFTSWGMSTLSARFRYCVLQLMDPESDRVFGVRVLSASSRRRSSSGSFSEVRLLGLPKLVGATGRTAVKPKERANFRIGRGCESFRKLVEQDALRREADAPGIDMGPQRHY
jgi:hypothetical protein